MTRIPKAFCHHKTSNLPITVKVNGYLMATMRSQYNVERVPLHKVRLSITRQETPSRRVGPSSQAYYSKRYSAAVNLTLPSGNVAGE